MTIEFDKNAVDSYNGMFNFCTEGEFDYNGDKVNTMEVREISVASARQYISSYHYTKTTPDSTLYCYAGYIGGKIAGVIAYGMGAGKNQYLAVIDGLENGEYIELTRLWSPDGMPKNTESKIISASMKMLPKKIKIVLSFSDVEQGHVGTIYQATNFLYLGKNKGGTTLLGKNGIKKHPRLIGIYRDRHPEKYGEMAHSELVKELGYTVIKSGQKHRYLMLRGDKRQKRDLMKRLKYELCEYPKKTNKQ